MAAAVETIGYAITTSLSDAMSAIATNMEALAFVSIANTTTASKLVTVKFHNGTTAFARCVDYLLTPKGTAGAQIDVWQNGIGLQATQKIQAQADATGVDMIITLQKRSTLN